jgi:hypothetical protein
MGKEMRQIHRIDCQPVINLNKTSPSNTSHPPEHVKISVSQKMRKKSVERLQRYEGFSVQEHQK